MTCSPPFIAIGTAREGEMVCWMCRVALLADSNAIDA
jgi:hypothetical protein